MNKYNVEFGPPKTKIKTMRTKHFKKIEKKFKTKNSKNKLQRKIEKCLWSCREACMQRGVEHPVLSQTFPDMWFSPNVSKPDALAIKSTCSKKLGEIFE